MTYRGRIRDGAVVFDEPIPLAEGTEVRVEVAPLEPSSETLAQKLLRYAGKAKDLPSDLAINHDHYLHGAPRRDP
jgi:hypothetical protein